MTAHGLVEVIIHRRIPQHELRILGVNGATSYDRGMIVRCLVIRIVGRLWLIDGAWSLVILSVG